MLQESSLLNVLYLTVNIITAQNIIIAQLSCLIVNIIIHLLYVHPSFNGYLFASLNLLQTANHGVTCILCHFQDTLRVSNHTLQNDASGLMFLLHVFAILCGLCFLALLSGGGAASHFSSIGIQLGLLYTGRGVAIGPNALWSTPFPSQESTFGATSRVFPWMLEWVVFSEHILQSAKCVLHCIPPESGV